MLSHQQNAYHQSVAAKPTDTLKSMHHKFAVIGNWVHGDLRNCLCLGDERAKLTGTWWMLWAIMVCFSIRMLCRRSTRPSSSCSWFKNKTLSSDTRVRHGHMCTSLSSYVAMWNTAVLWQQTYVLTSCSACATASWRSAMAWIRSSSLSSSSFNVLCRLNRSDSCSRNSASSSLDKTECPPGLFKTF